MAEEIRRSAAVVGQPILLNSRGSYVAGVAPREFHGVGLEILPPDIWMPFSAVSVWAPGALEQMTKRDSRGISVLLRLREGIPRGRAEAALTAVAARLAHDYPDTNKGRSVVLSPAVHKGMAILGSILLSLVGLVAPDWSVSGLVTRRQHLRLALFAWQAGAALVAVFAILGILLAGVGLYGLVAHSVSRRAHEIGVRVALGARPADILRLVTRQAVAGVAIGAALGMAAALAVARIISAALYQVSPADPIALCAGVAAVAIVTLLAANRPARRAARLDPMTVLRQE